VDGFTVVSWLPSAQSDAKRVPGSEFFVEYGKIGKCIAFVAADCVIATHDLSDT